VEKEIVLNISKDLNGNSQPGEIILRGRKIATTPFTRSTIIFATSEAGKPVVIKFPTKKSKAEREWTGFCKAYTADVPTPMPIALVTSKGGRVGVMQEEVGGQSLYKCPGGQARIRFGEIVKDMHLKVPTAGIEWQEKGKADYTYYDKRIQCWSEGQVELLSAGSTTQAMLGLLSPTMNRSCRSAPPMFNHNDLYDSQAIVGDQKIYLIDFEEWVEENPLNDIAYYLFHTIRSNMPEVNFGSFLSGYLGNEVLSEPEKQTLMFYLLFISARALNYFHASKSKYFEIAEKSHRAVTNYIDNENVWKS